MPPSLSAPPPCVCLQACWYCWGTCFLSQHHLCQVRTKSRPISIPVNTAGAPEQKGMQMFALAPLGAHIKSASLRLAGRPRQLQHSSPFLERKVSRVLRLSGVIHPYRCPFEIHVRGKMYSCRTRCTLLNMFKSWHFYRGRLKLLSCFVLFGFVESGASF